MIGKPANQNEIAPTAAADTPPARAGSHAAATGSGPCPRSAQPDEALQRAVKLMADHGRIVATQAADGAPKRRAQLLRQQGEIFFLAGLQLMAEAGAQ